MIVRHYDISVLLLIYEQPRDKILLTLASIIVQKGLNLQLIISDDGSSIAYEKECIAFMEEFGFGDYKILTHEKNQGTMKNFSDALCVADGEYIKVISPGDCLASEESLMLWLNAVRRKGDQISFCDTVYYNYVSGKYQCVIEVAHPQAPYVYQKKKSLQKKYYLLYNDIFLGASVLSERNLTNKYVSIMNDKIKYAEDNIYRLMILDGVNCSYFSYNAIYYEWGTGISTKANKTYAQQLQNDWEITTKYICEHCSSGYIESKIRSCYELSDSRKTFSESVLKKLLFIDLFFYKKKQRNNKRLSQDADLSHLYKLNQMVRGFLNQ